MPVRNRLAIVLCLVLPAITAVLALYELNLSTIGFGLGSIVVIAAVGGLPFTGMLCVVCGVVWSFPRINEGPADDIRRFAVGAAFGLAVGLWLGNFHAKKSISK